MQSHIVKSVYSSNTTSTSMNILYTCSSIRKDKIYSNIYTKTIPKAVTCITVDCAAVAINEAESAQNIENNKNVLLASKGTHTGNNTHNIHYSTHPSD